MTNQKNGNGNFGIKYHSFNKNLQTDTVMEQPWKPRVITHSLSKSKRTETSQNRLTESLLNGQINTVYSYSQGSIIAGNSFIQADKMSGNKGFFKDKKWVSIGGGHAAQNVPLGLSNATFYINSSDRVSKNAPKISTNPFARHFVENTNGRESFSDSACVSLNPIGCHGIYTYDWAIKKENSQK